MHCQFHPLPVVVVEVELDAGSSVVGVAPDIEIVTSQVDDTVAKNSFHPEVNIDIPLHCR